MEKRSLKLKLDGRSKGQVLLGGQDLSMAVNRVILTSQAGQPPRVYLEVNPNHLDIELEEAETSVKLVSSDDQGE